MHKLKSIGAVALAAALALMLAPASQAATCNVPSGSYPTIQSAASDPNCSTINVAPGVYNENVTVAFPNTTINGAQAGNPVAGRTSGGSGESTVNGATPVGAVAVFSIIATDVTIDGFTIKNSVTSGAATGIAVRAGGDDAAILTNIFDGIVTTDATSNGAAQAVYLTAGGPDSVNIEGNEMKNVQSGRSAKGVLIGDNGVSNNPSQNVQVKGNSIHDITSTTRGAYGVSVANVLNVSGLKITGNSFSALKGAGWVHAVGLEGDTPGATVNDNDFSNLVGPVTDTRAIWVESEDVSFASVVAHGNNFNLPASQFGIAVDPTLTGGPLNGTCNWWNSPSGPTAATNPTGTGASVSPNVTYNPWLISPAPGGSCFGGNVPTTAAQCKNGGWTSEVRADGSTFKNQGDCMQYVNTGK
jgi:hypothetical protein